MHSQQQASLVKSNSSRMPSDRKLTAEFESKQRHRNTGPANGCDSDNESLASVAQTAVEREVALTQVDELWFDEDNLIVRANDCLFRVSKGFLAARSPVLKQTLLENPGKLSTMLGCPVLVLPHSATSVTHFLKALFDADYFLPPPQRCSIPTLLEILRLAHIYQVKFLRKRALLHFSALFSSSMADVVGLTRLSVNADKECLDDRTLSPGAGGILLAAFQVASEVGALWSIPTIAYRCCTIDLAGLFALPEWESSLSVTQRRQLLIARDKQKSATRLISRFLLVEIDHCSTFACRAARLHWLKLVDDRSRKGHDSDPLNFWTKEDWRDMRHEFCEVCLAEYKRICSEEKVSFWSELPRWFGLPDWQELHRMEEEALKA
ncbi:hypothetical protein R3P38DRAFT_2956806 [Favolaschia claudopus]|uniref:BTB domain-containing protein n=1 Tax=Favolaschia claudopus TaxID=2862362 RepID=A0AAW0BD77_9AGAR